MLSIGTIIFLLLLALLIWLWNTNTRIKEIAIVAAKQICQDHGLQFLDGTPHLEKCRPQRHSDGYIAIRREYGFDYYDGEHRRSGTVITIAGIVTKITLDIDDATPPPTLENKSNVIPFRKPKH